MDLSTFQRSEHHIRALDIRHDLLDVANLIELCFANTLDSDGHDYIRHIRRAARDTRLIRFLPGAQEDVSIPLHGYVWEQDGRLIGNLTLIPFYHRGHWLYLIANVAVHPDYRRLGIGRRLTERALQHIRDHGASAAWLQVREDNAAAHQLYCSLGFKERARRTTWQSQPDQITAPVLPAGYKVSERQAWDWPQQDIWLHATYPPEVVWNLMLSYTRMNPALWAAVLRLIRRETVLHWCLRQDGHLIGTASWEPSRLMADTLWVAANPLYEDETIRYLLPYLYHHLPRQRILSLNYPKGQGEEALQQIGFIPQNTLIWMEVRFDRLEY